MFKYSSRKLLIVFLSISIANCAAKKPLPIEEPIESGQPPAEIIPSYPKDTELQPPIPQSPPAPGVHRVTLVAGGAGVSCFGMVGLLKKFKREGIEIDNIVCSGWPCLFAFGYGFLNTLHDLEWFAMRLSKKDFEALGEFDPSKDEASEEKLTSVLNDTFRKKDLNEAKIPIIVSGRGVDSSTTEMFDRGEWKLPLLKTMATPGIFRPFPKEESGLWITQWEGLDVREALRRGSKAVVAVECYEDYFTYLKEQNLANLSVVQKLRENLKEQLALAPISENFHIGKPPLELGSRRTAILVGAKVSTSLIKNIREYFKP